MASLRGEERPALLGLRGITVLRRYLQHFSLTLSFVVTLRKIRSGLCTAIGRKWNCQGGRECEGAGNRDVIYAVRFEAQKTSNDEKI